MITRFYFSHDRTTRWRLLTAVALGVVVMGYRLFLPNTTVSVAATRYAGYWLMLLTVVLFGLAAWEEVARALARLAEIAPTLAGVARGSAGGGFLASA